MLPDVFKMKKVLKFFTIFAIVTFALSLPVGIFAQNLQTIAEVNGIDVILLIDTSGSMRASDKGRNAIEAANLFIDMMETKNSRVGIIAFNDNARAVIDMTVLNSQEDKELLKQKISSFEYEGYTDIGMWLKEAVASILGNVRDKNSPMVLLLTDGNIEIDPESNARTAEASYNDIVEVLATVGKKLPIYTIGLNYNGNVDTELLKTVSESTDARNYIVKEANNLPQIFNEIFADHIQSSLLELASFVADGENYNEVKIDIQSDFVAEANIIMLSEKEVADVLLFNPQGVQTEFNHDKINFSKSNKYSIIKVISPEKGVWTLKAKGVKGDNIRVNLIYQFDFDVELSAQPSKDGSPYVFTGSLIVNGKKVSDETIYKATASTLVVTDSMGNVLEEFPMKATKDGLVCEYTPTAASNIELFIQTTGKDFTKKSNIYKIEYVPAETQQPVPVETKAPEQPPSATPTPPMPEQAAKPLFSTSTILLLAVTVVIVVLLIVFVAFYLKSNKAKVFTGYIEVRAMDINEKYTSLETPSLATYVNKTSLSDFLSTSLKPKTEQAVRELPFKVDNIWLSPGNAGNEFVINLENKSDCIVSDIFGFVMEQNKIIWHKDQSIVIKGRGDTTGAKLEMTYRTDEV